MPGDAVRLGPFVGGLNTASDPSSIEDTEVALLTNFDLDLDGSLVSRPPITKASSAQIPGTNASIKPLGFYVADDDTKYLIASNNVDASYAYNIATNVWTEISDRVFTAMVQHDSKAFLITSPSDSKSGGTWVPDTFTEVSSMPKGSSIVANKARLWISRGKGHSNSTRVFFSRFDSSNNLSWNSADFLNVSAGDGEAIVEMTVYYTDLVIFKERSTHRFSYDTDPAMGTVSRVSDNIGAANSKCFASYENNLYVLFDDKVYKFTNYTFERLNTSVPLKAKYPSALITEHQSIHVWSDRLFVIHYDTTYVYNLKTRTWSNWETDLMEFIGSIIAIPGEQGLEPRAYITSAPKTITQPDDRELYQIVDAVTDATEDNIKCTVVTKNYDYQSPQRFKRLFWWGIDVTARTDVRGIAIPITYAITTTWGELAHLKWKELGTWARPFDGGSNIVDDVELSGTTGDRKFIKMFKSLRFRQIGFRLEFTTDGSNKTAPARLFSIVTLIGDKQQVPKRVN